MQNDFYPTYVCVFFCLVLFFAIINFFMMTFLDAIEITSDGKICVCGAFYFNKFNLLYAVNVENVCLVDQ